MAEPPRLDRIDLFYVSRHSVSEPHEHAWHELVYVATGSYAVDLREGRLAGGAGDSFCYPRGLWHHPRRPGDPPRVFLLRWRDDSAVDGRPRVGHDPSGRMLAALHLLWDLYHGSPRPEQPVLDGMLAVILHLHASCSGGRDEGAGPVARARRYLAQRLAYDLSLRELAQAAGVSPTHLHRLFLAEVGMPPMRYRRQMRVSRAVELITTTRMDLANVATQVGIGNANHLSTLVRRHTGRTPTELRAGKPPKGG